MRIHQLNFQAIGPYAIAQRLDFSELDGVGLFLLDGPTGAGKSTILDIITFALYGSVGDDRKNTELQSTLAAPGTPPTLELDVSFGSRRFIIERTLQHLAPRRGTKDPNDLVSRNASMTLTEVVEGQHRQLTTRVDEAQLTLRSVIGLTREQFSSVVLLPQGEFARFLKASSNEREAILRQLFNTQRFEDLGDYLVEQTKQLKAAVEHDVQRRQEYRDALITLAEQHRKDDSPTTTELHELDDTALNESVAALIQEVEHEAQQRVQRSTIAVQAARDHAHQVRQLRDYHQEAIAYTRRRTAHNEQTANAEHAEAALVHHNRATPVITAQQHFDAATQQVETAMEQWQKLFDEAQSHQQIGTWLLNHDSFTTTAQPVADLRQSWKQCHSAAIRALEHVEYHQKTQTNISQQLHEIDQWKTQLQHHNTTLAKNVQDKAAAQHHLEELTQLITQGAGAQQEATAAQHTLEQAQLVQQAARAARQAKTRLDQATTQHQDATTAAENATAHTQSLLRRRIEAAAGLLAQQLEPEQPCAVCGSKQHPDPAPADGLTQISQDAVQQAENKATQLWKVALDAEATLTGEQSTWQTLQAQAGGISVEDAEAAVVTATQALTTAQNTVTQLAAQREQAQQFHNSVETLTTQHSALEQQCTRLDTQISNHHDAVEKQQQELSAALGEFATVEQLRQAVEPAHRLVTQIVNQADAVLTAQSQADTAQQRVQEALLASATTQYDAFADVAQARAALIDRNVVQEHEHMLKHWTTERDQLTEKAKQTAVLEGLKLLENGVQTPDESTIDKAQQAVTEHETAQSDAQRHLGQIETTRTQQEQHQQALQEISHRVAQDIQAYEELSALSDVVAGRGENSVGMPLRSFVLTGWLEQVAANASERLTGMTGGRYELIHAVGQGGRGLSGLNLNVIDHLNDTVRTPSTLSGGETFMASLALALGLADAVQAQAGGVAMDTLFIDEGFGSLDAETLEDVMAVLDTLQDDGRLIGLVSHVASMKQQIPHRIEVTKTQTGSTVRIAAPNMSEHAAEQQP